MFNPKTTIPGYFLVAAGVLTLIANFLHGTPIGINDVMALVSAAGGVGLIGASDGGH